jgi:hypothetical protein
MPYTEEEVLELARRAYRSGDASFAIEPGHCALLVIDMQNEFVRPEWTPYWVPEATRRIPTIRKLIVPRIGRAGNFHRVCRFASQFGPAIERRQNAKSLS